MWPEDGAAQVLTVDQKQGEINEVKGVPASFLKSLLNLMRMAVMAPFAAYRARHLFGVERVSPNDPDTDPRNVGLTMDDPHGHLRLEQVQLGPDDIVISRVSSTGYSGKMRDEEFFTFVFQRTGRYAVQIAGSDYHLPAGSLMAFRPNERFTRVRPGRSGVRAAATLQLPVARMHELARAMETSPEKIIPRDGMAMQGRVGQSLASLLPQLADDLMALPSAPPPPRVAQEIRHVIDEALCEMMGHAIEQPSSARIFPAFHRVRQAEELMHEHSDEPLSIQTIAQVLGVSLRSMQLAFAEVYGGLSPRDVLNRIRLEKARARLLAAAGDVQVTTVAMDCGLFHLGRFSQAYARTFGEKPSETLLRRRAS